MLGHAGLRRLLGIVLVATLTTVAPARPAHAMESELAEAIAAYEHFKFNKSLRLLKKAAGDFSYPKPQRALVQLYLGLVYATLGNAELSDRSFGEAILLEPAIELPPDTSPKVGARFDSIRSRVRLRSPDRESGDDTRGEETSHRSSTTMDAVEAAADGAAERDQRSSPPNRVWTWVTAASGGAALATGGVFWLLAARAESTGDGATFADDAAASYDRARSLQRVAIGVTVVGAAAVVAAVVLYFVEGNTASAPVVSSASVTTDGLGLVVRF